MFCPIIHIQNKYNLEYSEIKITVAEEYKEILVAELSQLGFDSFVEEEAHLLAYISSENYQKEAIEALQAQYQSLFDFQFIHQTIAPQNWNAVWEADYQPVIVAEQCLVRSTFHQIEKTYPYEITINPKMSFGTGHHETTSLMLEYLLEIDLKGKQVIDAGCGTGILAIMAEKRGAKQVKAFDIEEWAVLNGIENIALNHCKGIEISQTTIEEVDSSKTYQVILANINKNTLLKEISKYASFLDKNGQLLLSGFYTQDLHDLQTEAASNGLKFVDYKTKNNWVAAQFYK